MKSIVRVRHLMWAALLLAGTLCSIAQPVLAIPAEAAAAPPELVVPSPILEPLKPGHSGALPWAFNPVWFLLLGLILPAAIWTGLAWKRAFDTDPARLRRSGVRDLHRLIAELRRPGVLPQARHLYRWMDASARAWNLRVSTPTASEISSAVFELSQDAVCSGRWYALWCSTERGLFSAEAALPSDWLERAGSAADDIEMPPREHRLPDRRAHWLPTMQTLILATVLGFSGAARSAEVPVEDAPAVDWAQVQAPARSALQADWTDWAAHENLAMLNIDLENWNLAVAHGTASFLLHSSAPHARNNLRFALAQTAMADPTLKRLFFGAWYQRLPSWLSASGWQRLALLSGLLLAFALGVVVIALYRPRRRLLIGLGAGGGATAVLLLAVSVLCWGAYGDLRYVDVGMLVQKVNLSPEPTDLVPEEETAPLVAGSVVKVSRSFLGWKRIAASQGPSGWVRDNAVIPLYADR